ncbi:MAG TPA: PAS domain-containing protein [Myxococcota bacterium]|nr:PAS domain-containing protein [Myxococcota bacterium]
MDDLHRRTLEALPEAVLVADRAGAIQLWSAAATRIFGFSAEQTLGRSLDLIIPERQRARHWDGYRRVVATGVTQYGDRVLAVPALRADGKRISVEFTVALLRDARGQVDGIVALLRDVTERWERERERAKAASSGA